MNTPIQTAEDSPECLRELADLSITRRCNYYYYYQTYRYERAADAIAYARHRAAQNLADGDPE